MPKLQTELSKISKALVSLSKQVEQISRQVDKKQPAKKAAAKRKPAPARKPAAKKAAAKRKPAPARKPVAKKAAAAKGNTVLDAVYSVIKRSKNGATVAQLKQRTKLDARQLSNALYKLSKKGQVYAKSRGLYVKK
ncbi:MAG: hypothetical protein QNL14_13630 [Deltaproteobacteria bacterium]|nr:hypothetical protein [Deltaproteobacteria bacterium]